MNFLEKNVVQSSWMQNVTIVPENKHDLRLRKLYFCQIIIYFVLRETVTWQVLKVRISNRFDKEMYMHLQFGAQLEQRK